MRVRGGARLAPAALHLADLDGRHCCAGNRDVLEPSRVRNTGSMVLSGVSDGGSRVGREKVVVDAAGLGRCCC